MASATTAQAGVPMNELYCDDDSHKDIPDKAQHFVRANCRLPKMVHDQKQPDGSQLSRALHPGIVKQQHVNAYHQKAKVEWNKQEQVKNSKTEETTEHGGEEFEMLDENDIEEAKDAANSASAQQGEMKKSWAVKVWSTVTGK